MHVSTIATYWVWTVDIDGNQSRVRRTWAILADAIAFADSIRKPAFVEEFNGDISRGIVHENEYEARRTCDYNATR